MNYWKRAGCSLIYRWKNTLILFVVFLVLSTLILSGFAMLSACGQSAAALRGEVGASVLVNDYLGTGEDRFYGECALSPETVERIAGHPMVKQAYPTYQSLARKTEDIAPVVSEEQAEKYPLDDLLGESAVLRVESRQDLDQAPDLAADNYSLSLGRLFEPEDRASALISLDVARQNNIEVGDVISLRPHYLAFGATGGEVTVVGIFAVNQYYPYTDAPCYNSENLIYITPDMIEAFNGPDCRAYSIRCVLADPEQAQAFVQEVQGMDLPERDNLQFTIDDTQYRSMKSTVDSMTMIAAALLAASILLGTVVLVLLLMISLKDRDFELGVLLSLGESRGKILTQLILEALFPVLLAMVCAIFTGGLAEQWVGGLFGDALAASVSVTGSIVAGMFLCGIALTLLASVTAAYKVYRYQPKQILTAIE